MQLPTCPPPAHVAAAAAVTSTNEADFDDAASQLSVASTIVASELDVEATADRQVPVDTKPWSIYTKRQKKMIILAASIAATLSPLSGQIYFPAVNVISADLQVSSTLVNLTITAFLLMQGLMPSFIGALSDEQGRRMAYCLAFTLYAISNLGLGLQNSYGALLALRCLQSAGSSGTVALANAVVADVVTSAERGIYVSWTSVAPQLGTSFGPVIGGLLTQYVNWHFIFWFLLALTGVVFVPVAVFFPETCRKVVGNGSVPPPKHLRCYTNVLLEREAIRREEQIPYAERDALAKKRRLRLVNPLASLVLLFRKEVGFSLLLSSLLGCGHYAIITLIPSQFAQNYGLDELTISLCYLPLGAGSMLAAFVRGPVIDARFRYHARRLNYPLVFDRSIDLTDFPLERARLEAAIPTLLAGSLFTIGFGWLVQMRVSLALPLIFLFVIGFCVSATINTVAVLTVDMYPGKAGTATASNNLLRCWLGAGAAAAIIPMIDAIGLGLSTTVLGVLVLLPSPGLWYVMNQGPRWRKERRDKEALPSKLPDTETQGTLEKESHPSPPSTIAGSDSEDAAEEPSPRSSTSTIAGPDSEDTLAKASPRSSTSTVAGDQ